MDTFAFAYEAIVTSLAALPLAASAAFAIWDLMADREATLQRRSPKTSGTIAADNYELPKAA